MQIRKRKMQRWRCRWKQSRDMRVREREGEREGEWETASERKNEGEAKKERETQSLSHLSVHQRVCVTETGSSYRFPILPTIGTALCRTTAIWDSNILSKMSRPSAHRAKTRTFTSSPFFAFTFAICSAHFFWALAISFLNLSASFFSLAWPQNSAVVARLWKLTGRNSGSTPLGFCPTFCTLVDDG